jgi:hypothetical protein
MDLPYTLCHYCLLQTPLQQPNRPGCLLRTLSFPRNLLPCLLITSSQSPTPYWCWISGGFDAERIAGEYFWLWTAALSSIFLYTLLFFRLRGNIQVDPQNWKRIRIRLHPHSLPDEFSFLNAPAPSTAAGREAMAMIWYPICYTVLVLPLSIARWCAFHPPKTKPDEMPFAVTAVVIAMFGLSGVVNVVLIMLTRRNLLLFGQRRGVVNVGGCTQNQNQGQPGIEARNVGAPSAVPSQSQNAASGRGPTTSCTVDSTTLPETSLGRIGDHLDLKSILGGTGYNWEKASTHHASSIGVRSVASFGDLSAPRKFGATPAPPALPALPALPPPALYRSSIGNGNGKRKPVPDFEKEASESSVRPLRFSDSDGDGRERGAELNRSLSNVGQGDGTSVGMRRRSSLEPEDLGRTKCASCSGPVIFLAPRARGGPELSIPEAQVRRSKSQSNILLDPEAESHRSSHPLVPALSLLHFPSSSTSQLHLLVPPSVPPPPPPIPTSPLPRMPAL